MHGTHHRLLKSNDKRLVRMEYKISVPSGVTINLYLVVRGWWNPVEILNVVSSTYFSLPVSLLKAFIRCSGFNLGLCYINNNYPSFIDRIRSS